MDYGLLWSLQPLYKFQFCFYMYQTQQTSFQMAKYNNKKHRNVTLQRTCCCREKKEIPAPDDSMTQSPSPLPPPPGSNPFFDVKGKSRDQTIPLISRFIFSSAQHLSYLYVFTSSWLFSFQLIVHNVLIFKPISYLRWRKQNSFAPIFITF